MTGRRPFKELVDTMPAASRARVAGRVQQTLAEMRLAELRESLDIRQERLGAEIGIKQAAVSRLEGREDMLVSTLRDYVTALGGELEIVVRFAEGTFKIAGLNKERHGC